MAQGLAAAEEDHLPPVEVSAAGTGDDLMEAEPHSPIDRPTAPLDEFFQSPAPIRRIEWHQLENMSLLKHGSGSTLFTATLGDSPVVVKAPKHGLSHAEIAEVTAELQHEAQVLTKLHHPHIIRLFGAGTVVLGDHSVVFFIVVEKLEGGTLHDRLANMSPAHSLPFLEVLQCAIALAEALHYLQHIANPSFMTVHRDVKPDNIGFDASGSLRLFDFGLSTKTPRVRPGARQLPTYQMTGQTGSVRYMAPEVALGQPYNHKVDMYSFGMVCWEMMHGVKPFMGFGVDTHRQAVCLEGLRPPLDRVHPPDLNHLLADAWRHDHNLRPSSGEILSRLRLMLHAAQASSVEAHVNASTARRTFRDLMMGSRKKDGQPQPSNWFKPPKQKPSSVWF